MKRKQKKSGKNALMYPVLALNGNITKALGEICGEELRINILNGLRNEIEVLDMQSAILHGAQIEKLDPSDASKCGVALSAAFSQFVWYMCDIVLRLADRRVLQEGADGLKMSLNGFIKMSLKQFEGVTPFSNIKSYYRCVEMFGRPQFEQRLRDEVELSSRLLSGAERVAMKPFQKFKPEGLYEQRVNSAYLYAMAMVLLHERGHYDMGHMSTKVATMNQELEADQSALFTSLFSGLTDKRFSMICGMMLGFFAVLMCSAHIEEDGIHPDSLSRLNDCFNIVKVENEKYAVLYDVMMTIWNAYRVNVKVGISPVRCFNDTLQALI